MVRTLRNLAVVGLVALSLAAGAGSTGHPASAQTTTITIVNFAFTPATITVAPGATITWTNQDSAPHTVTSDTGLWDSGTLNPGASYSRTFSTPGTFPYHCAIHPFMKAQIIVQASGATATAPPNPTATPAGPSPSPTATSTPTATPQPTATSASTAAIVRLAINVSIRGKLQVGHSSSMRITIANGQTHRPVSGAIVALDARNVGVTKIVKHKTNSKGRATFRTLRPKRAGKITISASKKGFTSNKVRVRVRA